MEKDLKAPKTPAPNQELGGVEEGTPTMQRSALQQAANNSPRVQQLRQLQQGANRGAVQRRQNPLGTVQMLPGDISANDQLAVTARAQANTQNGQAITYRDFHRNNTQPNAMLALNATSMAADQGFETRAKAWEDRFSGFVYNHPRTKRHVNKAAKFAKDYLTQKHGQWQQANAQLDADLQAMGYQSTDVSGAVGNVVANIKTALSSGSVGAKMAHIDGFMKNVYRRDLFNYTRGGRTDATMTGLLQNMQVNNNPGTLAGMTRMDNSANQRDFLPMNGLAGDQWHMRAERHDQAALGQAGFNQAQRSPRTANQAEQATNARISPAEMNHMGVNRNQPMIRHEGAQRWALNERDTWVHAMREMSLPLKAAVSGTTARLMHGFTTMGFNDGVDNRLAAIAYLLPTHHHSLVEIMAGANGNGGPAFAPSQRFYRNIEPFKENELRSNVGRFPDEG